MQEAIRQANMAALADEVPVGAVIVFERKIIAKAHNQIETLKDPTAHAEMIAITQAAPFSPHPNGCRNCTREATLEPLFHVRRGLGFIAYRPGMLWGLLTPRPELCGWQ